VTRARLNWTAARGANAAEPLEAGDGQGNRYVVCHPAQQEIPRKDRKGGKKSASRNDATPATSPGVASLRRCVRPLFLRAAL